MALCIEAACICNIGKIRKNNEDNFLFDGQSLDAINDGLKSPLTTQKELLREIHFAVFDGMGGENYGELASYAAADFLKNYSKTISEYFLPKTRNLTNLCRKMNAAVVRKEKELLTERMGSTVVGLCFTRHYVYSYNLGDSRAYRLRAGILSQLSVDHVEKRDGQKNKKAPLTQHLGIDPERYLLEPYIQMEKLQDGDTFLLCSDGLTDMLSDSEICEIISLNESVDISAQKLLDSALEKGGRDNVTVILCRVEKSIPEST